MSKYRIDITQQAQIFKALGNPNRLALFKRLMDCCPPGTLCSTDGLERYCVGDLGEGLGIAPSTLSHHLKELAAAGLVQTQRRGKQVECWIEPSVLSQLAGYFRPSDHTSVECCND